jgi:hypothetical protein
MKSKILKLLAILPIFIGCSGSSPAPPFQYKDNSRIVIEGRLINPNQSAAANQLVQLFAKNGGYQDVLINQAVSDSQGDFFITSPKGIYSMYIVFPEKNVSATSNNSYLIKQFQWMGLGYLDGTYYKFNSVLLIN